MGNPRILAVLAIGPLLALALGAMAETSSSQAAPSQRPPSQEAPSQEAKSGNSPHGNLATPCSDCHTTEGWTPLAKPLAFDHGATGFDLEASHRNVACLDCHGNLEFSWVASACADCHRDPHQGELGLSCSTCHDPRGWEEARQQLRDRHAASLFPLTGAHVAVDCASCHQQAAPHEFSITPTDCFACHRPDYQQTRNPNHAQAGFPTTCELCHSTDEWEMAEFRGHDSRFFPIFSGPHEGVWSTCSNCHTAPNNFNVFSCFQCHSRGEMNDEHDDVRGYRYDSQACYACHPDGRE